MKQRSDKEKVVAKDAAAGAVITDLITTLDKEMLSLLIQAIKKTIAEEMVGVATETGDDDHANEESNT
mgnify:CR=1 FL=1